MASNDGNNDNNNSYLHLRDLLNSLLVKIVTRNYMLLRTALSIRLAYVTTVIGCPMH